MLPIIFIWLYRATLSVVLKLKTGPARELLDGVLNTQPNTNPKPKLNPIHEMFYHFLALLSYKPFHISIYQIQTYWYSLSTGAVLRWHREALAPKSRPCLQIYETLFGELKASAYRSKGAFRDLQYTPKCVSSRGAGPRWGSCRCSPDLLVSWEGEASP